MDLDVLERARCGSREAFRALVAAWGDRVLRTAVLIIGDRARAERAAVATLRRVWRELPALHSERPFRPMLMRALLEALPDAEGDTTPGDADADAGTGDAVTVDVGTSPPPIAGGVRGCIEALGRSERSTIVLHLYDQMGAAELAPVRGTNLGVAARDLRGALRALRSCAETTGGGFDEQRIAAELTEMARGVELPPWFAEELEPRLADPDGPTVKRLVAIDPARAWAQIVDPATLPRWVQATDVRVRGAARLEPGARVHADGRIAARRPSRDETLITRADDQVLAWTTRSRIKPWPSAIEFRWTLAVLEAAGGCELVHTLRGVSFPPGASSRFLRAAYARAGDAMPTSMHAGIEQLAQLLEAGARRTSI